MKILVANVGSTTFKYRLFHMGGEVAGETVLAEGRIERIGEAQCPVEHRIGNAEVHATASIPDYPTAIHDVIQRLTR